MKIKILRDINLKNLIKIFVIKKKYIYLYKQTIKDMKKTITIITTLFKIIHIAMALTFFSWVLYSMIINII